jgi:hypothetical protein
MNKTINFLSSTENIEDGDDEIDETMGWELSSRVKLNGAL